MKQSVPTFMTMESMFSVPDEDQTYHGHYTIHNLRPGSTYQLEIRARNGYGWSQLSKLHTFFTLSGFNPKSKTQFSLFEIKFHRQIMSSARCYFVLRPNKPTHFRT